MFSLGFQDPSKVSIKIADAVNAALKTKIESKLNALIEADDSLKLVTSEPDFIISIRAIDPSCGLDSSFVAFSMTFISVKNFDDDRHFHFIKTVLQASTAESITNTIETIFNSTKSKLQ